MIGNASKRRVWLALLAIFLIAAGVRFSFWSEIRHTALDRWQRFDQSDMATYVEQARRIAQGDLLQSEPYHPSHSWQTIAPAQKWLVWYGPHSFHQAPAYSYLLAWVGPVAGEEFALVKAFQLLLGAGTCVLLFLIGHQLWGFTAGCVAGLLAAIYGPLPFLEAQLLREGPALFCILGIVFALMRHLEQRERPTRSQLLACAALGAAAGAFAMLHELGSITLLVVLISLMLGHARSSFKFAALAVGCALAGWLIGFAPLLARNLAVGAPPFSVSCRTGINFVESNVADAADGGATFTAPSATAVKVLDEAGGSGFAALVGVWKSYDGNFGLALSNFAQKVGANWIAWEILDNTSFEFFREETSTLRFAPTFAFVFPLGFAGFICVLWTLARGRRQIPQPTKKELKRLRRDETSADELGRAPAVHGPLSSQLVLLLLFLGLFTALSLVHTVARFRMYLVPICIVYSGILLAMLWQALREKNLGRVGAFGLLVLAGIFLQRSLPTGAFVQGLRTIDYAVACKLSIERGEFDGARRYAKEARAKFPTDGLVQSLAGSELERAGQRELALEFYRQALEIEPGSALAGDGVRRLAHN